MRFNVLHGETHGGAMRFWVIHISLHMGLHVGIHPIDFSVVTATYTCPNPVAGPIRNLTFTSA
jgi:hypothetical protein